MNNSLYTFIALIIAGGLVYGAHYYTQHDNVALLNNEKKEAMLTTISASAFAEKNTTETRTIIDVRTKEEYDASHIEDAINLDMMNATFTTQLSELDKNEPYSIYCRSGNRSEQVLRTMEKLGFTDVIDLNGGVVAWQQNGNTLCTDC
jgi:rhodanese-related sulfurtransferase